MDWGVSLQEITGTEIAFQLSIRQEDSKSALHPVQNDIGCVNDRIGVIFKADDERCPIFNILPASGNRVVLTRCDLADVADLRRDRNRTNGRTAATQAFLLFEVKHCANRMRAQPDERTAASMSPELGEG